MKNFNELSIAAQDKFRTLHWVLTSASQQQHLYQTAFTKKEKEQMFTPQQRAALSGPAAKLDLPKLKIDLRQSWQAFSGHSIPRSDLELAQRANMITDAVYRWLMEELGEQLRENSSPLTPLWKEEARELRYQDEVVRSVPRPGVAKNIVTVLNAFEAAGWPTRIDNPLKLKSPQKLRDTLKSVNEGLEKLRFESDGTSTGILWRVLPVSTIPG